MRRLSLSLYLSHPICKPKKSHCSFSSACPVHWMCVCMCVCMCMCVALCPLLGIGLGGDQGNVHVQVVGVLDGRHNFRQRLNPSLDSEILNLKQCWNPQTEKCQNLSLTTMSRSSTCARHISWVIWVYIIVWPGIDSLMHEHTSFHAPHCDGHCHWILILATYPQITSGCLTMIQKGFWNHCVVKQCLKHAHTSWIHDCVFYA